VITASWPRADAHGVGDHQRSSILISGVPGRYFTGDGAKRDEDGYYWITGRSTTC